MRSPRHDVANGNPQADDSPPPVPADREARLNLVAGPGMDLHRELARLTDPEARLNLAARALGQDIRILRGMTPVPGSMDLPALADHD
jgi:hypothetical protein